MMDVRQARAENLAKLLRRHPSLRVFADRTELAPAHVSQMKNGVRRMGDEVARRIEAQLRLPHGWMDHPHGDGEDTPVSAATAPSLDQLLSRTSPRAQEALELIAHAAEEGRLSEADIALIHQLAARLASTTGKYERLRRTVRDDDPTAE
ncbi:hypothetical protein [Thiorhodococcus minor]|uniref:XRE family transcriptional regulator n=1 Tax=Thiorhodococcus minor TaxID=57489 RepID=A0A6M0K5K9_9GAMM|nr:hypothetical protein [Thiorhodococcus minor]NEV64719.1 hypothetical protein [Thiorhodococcus minor]